MPEPNLPARIGPAKPPDLPAGPARPAPPRRVAARRWLRAKDLLVVVALAGLGWQFGLEGGTAAPAGAAAAMQAGSAPEALPPRPLVTEVAAPGYAHGTPERLVFETLNAARARGNFGLLAQDARLDAAAAAHAGYMALNLAGAISHRQQADRPGYTGETPRERIRAAGYDTAVSFEAVSSGTTAGACLELLNTVYHLGSLMAGATDVGIAVHPQAGCVIEPQVPGRSDRLQVRRAGTLGVYPYPGQAGVPPAFMPATEVPNPAPDLGDAVVGPPILVDLNAESAAGGLAGSLVLSRFVLAPAAGGEPLPVRALAGPGAAAPADAGLDLRLDRRLAGSGQVFLLPLQPLKPATAYAVQFDGTVNGQPVGRRWEFRTR